MNQPLAKQKEQLNSDIQSLRKQLEKSLSQGNRCATYQIETDLKGLEREFKNLSYNY